MTETVLHTGPAASDSDKPKPVEHAIPELARALKKAGTNLDEQFELMQAFMGPLKLHDPADLADVAESIRMMANPNMKALFRALATQVAYAQMDTFANMIGVETLYLVQALGAWFDQVPANSPEHSIGLAGLAELIHQAQVLESADESNPQ